MTRSKTAAHRPRAAPREVEPPRINWPQIIADLLRAGCSKYRIAASLGVLVSNVQHWQITAGDIRYGYGRALLRLHSRHCGAALTTRRINEGEPEAYTSRP